MVCLENFSALFDVPLVEKVETLCSRPLTETADLLSFAPVLNYMKKAIHTPFYIDLR
jgi:hypothetical protein